MPRGQLGHGECSAQIQRVFTAQDTLQTVREQPEKLLDQVFRLATDHELEHLLHVNDEQWLVHSALIRQTEGLAFTGKVDRLVATLLAGCNGRRSLRILVTELVTQLDLPFDTVAKACIDVFSTLLRMGFLEPGDARPDD